MEESGLLLDRRLAPTNLLNMEESGLLLDRRLALPIYLIWRNLVYYWIED